jgi:dTDP-4-dehydrorhamnose reductase
MLIENKADFGQAKKVLIFGAEGNLGGQLMRVFGNEYRLICLDKTKIDLRNKEDVLKVVFENNPDIIINTVAYNAVDKCEENEEEYEKAKLLSGYATGFTARAALEAGAIHIHYSSDYVFGGLSSEELKKNKKQGGFKENDQPHPGCNYARAKLLGEEEVLNLQSEGLKYYIIRTAKLFGPKALGKLSKPGFFEIMLNLSKEKDELDVVDEEEGCFTYTLDLAKETLGLIEEKKDFGIYHIVNTKSYTWFKALKLFFSLTKTKIKLNPVKSDFFSRPAKRPIYSVLKNTKLKPMRNLKDALKEYVRDDLNIKK